MQNRETLIAQVKEQYALLADWESREGFQESRIGAPSPEAYYETLLNQVLEGIDAGRFDSFASGREIVEAVARDRNRWGIPGA